MKKYILTFVAFVAALCACNKIENIIPEPQAPEDVIRATELVFTATMEGAPETRATYDGTYKCASWEVDDRISINGFDYKANNAGTSTTFSKVAMRPEFVSTTNTGSYQNQPAQNLVDDGGVNTRWIADKSQRVAGAWNIVVSTGKAVYLKSIKLWNYDNESYPTRRWKTMRLYGSTTTQDDEWEEISDPAPLTSSHPFADLNLAKNNRGLAGEIAVNSTKAYTFYRIDVLDNEGDDYMQMSDMKFVVAESETLEPPYTAYFPADLYNGTSAVLPAIQTYASGKFDMPMYAHSETTSLSFKNLCGVLAITVSGADFASVEKIEVFSDKQMNGEFSATAAGVLSFASVTLTDALKKVALEFTSAKTIASDGSATFYIPVPANTHNPLTIKVTGGSSTKIMVTKKSGGVAVERNKVYPITFDGELIAGTANANINSVETPVNWVQLWENGPKFAEYNVGAKSATEYGGLYNWGMSEIQTSDNYNEYQSGTADLTHTGDNITDTATKLWGSKWRMPTKTELEALINSTNCTVEKVVDPNNAEKLLGKKFTGKGAYASNSVFLPAAGCCDNGNVGGQGYRGNYWSSTPSSSTHAYYLGFDSGSPYVYGSYRDCGHSVRAVLAE